MPAQAVSYEANNARQIQLYRDIDIEVQFATYQTTYQTIKIPHRRCLPVRLSRGGCSFQFGRTSILFPRLPHLAQTTLLLKYGTSDSAG